MRKLSFVVFNLALALILYSCTLTDVDEPTKITGIVTNSSGNGIDNVSLQFKTTTNDWTVHTSSDGKYIINLPSGGTGFITLSKEGYTTKMITMAIVGGEHQKINVKMNTLVEDAYVKTEFSNIFVKNNAGKQFVKVQTNVKFEVECKDEWVRCSSDEASVYIEYAANLTSEPRLATITLNAEYGLKCLIYITQDAKPA
ncbi:carboxypeptidase regulatory-like domain-containing protein [Bacteroides sedimenti]